MNDSVYINLPVANLERSKAFYRALGYAVNEEYSNDVAACIVLGEHIYAMLLTHAFFATFTDKTIIDAQTSVQVLNCLEFGSRADLDAVHSRAAAAGGRVVRELHVEHQIMYGSTIEDPDGHLWELLYMDQPAP